MPSHADEFEERLEAFKEFVDEDGRHFFVIQFEDDSGRILRKKPSTDEKSVAEFVIRDRFAADGMRMIASATEFDFNEERNTQQNLHKLMK